MEKKRLVICDTNILIEVIDRNNKKIIEFLVELGESNLCISSVTHSELLMGASNKRHLSILLTELGKFILIPIDSQIDQLHRKLIEHYGLSHKLSIQDALIAATAIHYDSELFSLNKKDFRFIEGLKLL